MRVATKSRTRPRLSRTRIVTAALGLADREGIDAVSMRRVADRLGVQPMALYRHVRDKDDLLNALGDAVLGDLDLPDPLPGDWREQLETLVVAQRQAVLKHPALAPRIAADTPLGSNSAAFIERALTILLAAGFPPDESMWTVQTLVTFTLGSVAPPKQPGTPAASARVDRVRQAFASLPLGEYPSIARAYAHLGEVVPFDFGLNLILDGLAGRRPRKRART